MKTLILFFAVLLSGRAAVQAQSSSVKDKSQKLWAQIKKDMESGAIEAGCTATIELAAYGGQVACTIPEPTVSKFACSIATVLNSGDAAKGVAVMGCQATYAISKNTIIVFLNFAKGQFEEFVRTIAYFEQNLQATYLDYSLKRRF